MTCSHAEDEANVCNERIAYFSARYRSCNFWRGAQRLVSIRLIAKETVPIIEYSVYLDTENWN